jgi:hypothetical protein
MRNPALMRRVSVRLRSGALRVDCIPPCSWRWPATTLINDLIELRSLVCLSVERTADQGCRLVLRSRSARRGEGKAVLFYPTCQKPSDDVPRSSAMHLVKLVEHAVGAFGLAVHASKTKILPPRARKVMLGVLVDRERPRLTRSFRNNLETRLYALTSPKIGPRAHMQRRGFASRIGMQRHVGGLLAFAHQVDRSYAAKQYRLFNAIDWES